jgi:maleylacetate reductase
MLPHELDAQGLHRTMLIVSIRRPKLAELGRSALGHRLIVEWSAVRQHVPRELADRAAAAARAADADSILAVGGGSTIGLGKAVAVSTGLPLVAVPSTYAGSEMTPIYGITEGQDKRTARDNAALPRIVAYNPDLFLALPPAIVGPSGLNALAHCAEALWAPLSDPITDALAVEGAHRLQRSLPQAYNTSDPGARADVLIAACLAGIALGTVGTSLHHSLCHLLGGMCDAPHAETHAMVLPYVVGYLQPALPRVMMRLAEAMDCASDDLATQVWSLARGVGAPAGLRAVGISQESLDAVAQAAVDKPVHSPRELSLQALQNLLRAA